MTDPSQGGPPGPRGPRGFRRNRHAVCKASGMDDVRGGRLLRLLRGARELVFGERTRFDLGITVVLLCAALAAWGFLGLADEVLEGDTQSWDRSILLALRTPGDTSDPIGPAWLEEAVRDCTALGGVVAISGLTLLVIGYLLLDGRRRIALLIAASIAGGLVLSLLLKHGFQRARPDLVPHGSVVATASFPSGHSMMAAIAYLTLGALLARTLARKRLKIFVLVSALVLTTAIGFSRVYLGVHWPSDVLAGWAGGACWAAVCSFTALRLQLAGAAEPER